MGRSQLRYKYYRGHYGFELSRPHRNRAIHHGISCIKGARVPVSVIVGSIADGATPEQILASWPQLCSDNVKAALKFAAETVSNADFIPFPPVTDRQ